MKLIFGLVVVGVVAVVETSADDKCGEGGVWNSCASPCRAVPTCVNPNPVHVHRICPAICEPQCVCTSGYVMHNGRCISRAHCHGNN
ncbi:venom serine protease inhibitor-like [Euwallacea similis]|uniref:venom serine protease inhibitor-like n=1 Tax=Euwallacea similis TaxID=1736056 RepID=UPI00344D924B